MQFFWKVYAKFQPYQDITFIFMFQPLEILFCQIKILIVQNASAHLMATASTMVPMSLYQRTDDIYWRKKICEKIYGFSYPKISFVGLINI